MNHPSRTSSGGAASAVTGVVRTRQPLHTASSGIEASPALLDAEQNVPPPVEQRANTNRSTTSNPFVCNVCKRSYSRVDHLARHYRSHTHEKPFMCVVCSKDFARADLLKRHAKMHDSGDVQRRGKGRPRQTNSPRQTRRVSQACRACAFAKIKCGEEKPCRRCQQQGIECTLANPLNDSRNSTTTDNADGIAVADTDEHVNESIMVQQHNLDSFEAETQAPPLDMFTPISFPHEDERSFPNTVSAVPSDPDTQPLQHDDQSMLMFDDSSFAEFLRDIISPDTTDGMARDPVFTRGQQNYTAKDVFDFGIDSSLDFNDLDFDWIDALNMQAPNLGNTDQPLTRGQQTPDISNGLNLGAEAFQKSLWRWAPAGRDTGYAEQESILLSIHETALLEMGQLPEAPEQWLDQPSRDRILAMLLGTCSAGAISRVVTALPSAQVLNSFMHLYFQRHASSVDSWIHIPTFRPTGQKAELNGIVIAAGAVLSSVPAVRKLGFALQEAVRLALPKAFESDNRLTRDLQLLQAYALELSVMIWSGNRRKMEIAESHAQPLITMLRRAGRYRRARLISEPPYPEDTSDVLRSKWHQWAESESFKRLAFHTMIHDSQTSVAFLVRPLLSYTEIFLELPCHQTLWRAKSAESWRDAYRDHGPSEEHSLPSLLHCIHDIQPLLRVQNSTDLQNSISIILHAIWSLVAEFRQLQRASKLQGDRQWHGVLMPWHRELCQLLDHFRMAVSESEGGMYPETLVLQELCMMNLHLSFEELQLFAGKEGSEEAQRVYPLLGAWKESQVSRQAMWHAGQIVLAARACSPNHLSGFSAIALYHASLAFWVFGMISMGTSRRNGHAGTNLNAAAESKLIWLDSEETAESRRWIAIQRGIPVIRTFPSGQAGESYARLDDPRAVMDVVIDILGKGNGGGDSLLSPLVENLLQLMRDLGNAAWAIKSR